ncbi:hypothetical protein BDR04DRAFT_1164406 [Suillus decipiens]|nr:hypothetical protein BDR04DRAFT_1164406 [Suillus decipiens]
MSKSWTILNRRGQPINDLGRRARERPLIRHKVQTQLRSEYRTRFADSASPLAEIFKKVDADVGVEGQQALPNSIAAMMMMAAAICAQRPGRFTHRGHGLGSLGLGRNPVALTFFAGTNVGSKEDFAVSNVTPVWEGLSSPKKPTADGRDSLPKQRDGQLNHAISPQKHRPRALKTVPGM